MAASQTLSDVFERGLENGINSLSPVEQELFYIEDFIIDFEMGGLSPYLYNRLPDIARIRRAVDAMYKHRLNKMAKLLEQAADLFNDYADPDPPSTWSEVLKQYDPTERIEELHKSISELDDYGLAESTIR